MRRPVLREVSSPTTLPDDMLEAIISKISPLQLVASGWDGVSRGFADLVERHLHSSTVFNCFDEENVELVNLMCRDQPKLLRLFIDKYLWNVETLILPACLLSQIIIISEEVECILLPNLRFLQVVMGKDYAASSSFEVIKTARWFSERAVQVHMEICIGDGPGATCCQFRQLVRVLSEITTDPWNLTLRDRSLNGQSWVSPTEICSIRDMIFVCYVRVLLCLRVGVKTLHLIDEHHPSPYMMVMNSSKRRSLYMFHEFKMCEELIIDYDIGMIAPPAGEIGNCEQLKRLEVNASHVLYKGDLLDYLKNATGLRQLCVHRPRSWTRRVATCTKGCFANRDFACFRTDGWMNAIAALPNAQFELD